MRSRLDTFSPYLLLVFLFVAAVAFRPLLPVDETRYMTVAWEMYLNKNYFLPTMNFAPYHHKPPMLFWLINVAWNIFGVSRWAGLFPIFIASAAVIFLTKKLAEDLFPDKKDMERILPWMMIGSFPFMAYGTLVMFDLMITAIVLATLLVFRSHARNPRWQKIVVSGFLMGAGVLTKGPVAYLYILSCLLLYPFWKGKTDTISNSRYYASLAAALLLSTLPVLAWLVPALAGASDNFAFWLIWEQTAGRITGNFSAAHVRPFYFYLAILPVLFLPWGLSPTFWTSMKSVKNDVQGRFLLSAILPAFLCFCLISGKQPHYILPLLPYILIFMARLNEKTAPRIIRITSIFFVCVLIAGQAYATRGFFDKYDVSPFADFYAQHRDQDWGFVRNYQGQIGFLGKSTRPMDNLQMEDVANWMKNHPDGYVLIRYNPSKETMGTYHVIMTGPHQGKMLSIIQEK